MSSTDKPVDQTSGFPLAGELKAANLLGAETSPYLHQHRNNPVHWRAWGPAAFAEAKAADKPVLLSVGYAACHWCHVMAHESFEDEATAAVMNELFVNIKVDREERPDIDGIYQHALQMLGEQGGWPLTMFLTPAAEPFWGGTYFPNQPRYGRPGFAQVLKQIAEIYRLEPDKVTKNAGALKEALGQLSRSQPGGQISIDLLDKVAEELVKMIDTAHGGIGGAPKFPQVPILELLWRGYKRTGKPVLRDGVIVSLDRMCQGGIYDHVGGGFARYSVDAFWLVPHFEKMLYDNAQLIDIMTLVWQETGSRLYADRIAETIDWLLREMVVEGGGFAGTLDADSEGEEGKFYVWREAEIDAALGDEAARFKAAYDVTAGGNWEGKTILNRTGRPELGDDAHEAALKVGRDKLLKIREKRIRPGLDDKVLADWNGLMIAALANAGLVFERPDWIDAAATAFGFVRDAMTVEGRLRHSWRGAPAHPATLDDYANMTRAAVALFEATADSDYLDQAEDWIATIDAHYRDPAGGYFLSADDVDEVLVRQKIAHDNATPAGNAVLVGVFARLYYLTGNEAHRDRAEALIGAFSGGLERNVFSLTTLMNGAELLSSAVQIVLAGDPASDAVSAMRRAALSRSEPNRILLQLAPGTDLPEGHPAHGKTAPDGGAAAFVCRGTTCSLPITDPGALALALAGAAQPEAAP
ncbi:MAG: thioredoxin domain-containing protein [Alphaproteobacteria bacterium]|nr:thioredoxin domain-containing protein [Alphaproteobacteria bacterium]